MGGGQRPHGAGAYPRGPGKKAGLVPREDLVMEESVVESDHEEEAAAADADGDGVWDKAFCAVCDCLIETERGSDGEKEMDDSAWEALAVTTAPAYARSLQRKELHRPRAPPERRGSLFCSERCRRVDEARSERMSEFMQYVAPQARSESARRLSQPALPLSVSLRDIPVPTARSLATYSLGARPSPVSEEPPKNVSRDSFDASRKMPVAPVASPVMSNLARARQAQSTSPTNVLDSEVLMSPTQTSVLGVSAASVSSSSEPRSALSTSPLGLLPRGHSHHAEPSVSVATGARRSLSPRRAATADARGTPAVQALRRAKDGDEETRPGGRSLTGVFSSMLPRRNSDEQSAGAERARAPGDAPGARVRRSTEARGMRMGDAINARNLQQVPVEIRDWRPREGSGSDASSSAASGSKRSSDSRRRDRRRSRDVHVLPPLLCPPRTSSRYSSSAGTGRSSEDGLLATTPVHRPHSRQSGLHRSLHALGATLTPNPGEGLLSRSAGQSSSGAHTPVLGVPGTSPRRAGLGWSALTPVQQREEAEVRRAAGDAEAEERPASSASSGWRYTVPEGDPKMYPILQLPGADIHDLYSEYWQSPDALQQAMHRGTEPGADEVLARHMAQVRVKPGGASEGRRKSLFHFDG